MNPFLRRYNELMSDLERKMTVQANLTNEQNELIERLTNENSAYKVQLESLTATLASITSNTAKQETQFTALIAKLNSENSRLMTLLQNNKKN